jgi:hypothetical protein
MPNVIKHPSAPVSARKTEQQTKLASKAQLRFDAAQARYFRAVLDFTHAVAIHNRNAGVPLSAARTRYEVQETTALAVEAAAAKLLGGSEPTASRAATYKDIAVFMAAEAPVYENISEDVA